MRIILFFICSLSLFASGGAMGVPPEPKQRGANKLTNPGFEDSPDFTGWTTLCSPTIDSTVSRSGTKSAKFATACGSGSVNALSRTVNSGTKGSIYVRAWIRVSSDFNGTLSLFGRDSVHGGGFVQSEATNIVKQHACAAGAACDHPTGKATAGGWLDLYRDTIVWVDRHGNENLQVTLTVVGHTAGTFWVDDFEVADSWYPIRTFLRYPNYRGFLWQGEDPPICGGMEVEEICGTSQIIPTGADTLSDVKLELKIATAAGCATGVASAQTINPVTTEHQEWSFDGSGLALDTDYFLCSTLRRVADSALVATYNDWKIIKKTLAFRATLKNWIGHRGEWWHQGQKRFPWGTYTRHSGTFSCDVCQWSSGTGCTPNQASAKDCYLYNIDGYSLTNLPESAVKSKRSSNMSDQARARHSVGVGNFSFASTYDFSDLTDEGTPYAQAMSSVGVATLQISNTWHGYLWTETNTSQAPPAPSLQFSGTGGSIGSAFVYVRVSAVKTKPAIKTFAVLVETVDSVSANNVTALSGSTNSVVVTPPACSNEAVRGFWIYAATAASQVEPASSAFSRQTNHIVPCGGSHTLTAIMESGVEVAASDNTINTFRPFWFSSSTDPSRWAIAWNKLANANAAGAYLCDECVLEARGWMYRISKHLRDNAPGLPSFGVSGDSGQATLYYRDILDIPSIDPYPYGQVVGPDQNSAGAAVGRSADVFQVSTTCPNCIVSEPFAHLSKTDLWVDRNTELTYNSRPSWNVIQQWNRSTTGGMPYAELRRQVWKAIIGVQNRGMIGGVITWGWVSSLGMEDQIKARGHTQALEDHFKVGDELVSIEDALLAAPVDSTYLGAGTVVTGVSASITLPTANCKGYASPVRFVTKRMGDGTDWIFATNLCQDTMTATFTLNSPAADAIAVSHPDGAKLAITGGQISVPLDDFGVGAIRISRPVGARATANKSTT